MVIELTEENEEPKGADVLENEKTTSYKPFAEISKNLIARAKGKRQSRGGLLASAGEGQPHAVDIHVGAQLKKLRGRRGLSQQALAERLGLTFQQVQKYEGGKNRISASRMYEVSLFLGVTPGYFFEGMDPKLGKIIGESNRQLGENTELYQAEEDIMAKTESIRMMSAFYKISDQSVRLALRMLINKIAKVYDGDEVDFDDMDQS